MSTGLVITIVICLTMVTLTTMNNRHKEKIKSMETKNDYTKAKDMK